MAATDQENGDGQPRDSEKAATQAFLAVLGQGSFERKGALRYAERIAELLHRLQSNPGDECEGTSGQASPTLSAIEKSVVAETFSPGDNAFWLNIFDDAD